MRNGGQSIGFYKAGKYVAWLWSSMKNYGLPSAGANLSLWSILRVVFLPSVAFFFLSSCAILEMSTVIFSSSRVELRYGSAVVIYGLPHLLIYRLGWQLARRSSPQKRIITCQVFQNKIAKNLAPCFLQLLSFPMETIIKV